MISLKKEMVDFDGVEEFDIRPLEVPKILVQQVWKKLLQIFLIRFLVKKMQPEINFDNDTINFSSVQGQEKIRFVEGLIEKQLNVAAFTSKSL